MCIERPGLDAGCCLWVQGSNCLLLGFMLTFSHLTDNLARADLAATSSYWTTGRYMPAHARPFPQPPDLGGGTLGEMAIGSRRWGGMSEEPPPILIYTFISHQLNLMRCHNTFPTWVGHPGVDYVFSHRVELCSFDFTIFFIAMFFLLQRRKSKG